ncbi:ThiF family adenylyltransferase [Paenibacillus sp. CMAA1739]|uniref:ThiF family adenylyltransferase n=1 Tax=Paenibacillus ottowii TaxID=2315729 RepID=UPI00273023E0|nr:MULTISPECIES: ThiF family adenylyltransferase [Paenibacillus]MDP1509273.1 ThiF family adenylyltransferase [Paenibacillus ottowii]MEC4564600.1 ThiF family adenylyltransferase [Paenibacillus sp. CMAA1739]
MKERYSRQILFRPIGSEGQRNLSEAVVTIIGCGALGSAIAETLVRAGVGEIHLVDRDYVETSNLQRQQLFTEQDAAQMLPKVTAAEKRLKAIREDVRLYTYLDSLDAGLAQELAGKSTLLMDATDNFETRLLINDAALKAEIPWIYGACVGSTGVVFPFVPGKSACFRCLLPSLPAINQTCDTAGIISPAVQVTAALQSAEAMKWLSGKRDQMRSKVHLFDLWENTQMDIGISRIHNPDCPTCGEQPVFPALTAPHRSAYAALCGRDVVQVLPDPHRPITLDDAEKMGRLIAEHVKRTPYFVEFYAFKHRMILFKNGRLLIHGIGSVARGQKLYHQLFG